MIIYADDNIDETLYCTLDVFRNDTPQKNSELKPSNTCLCMSGDVFACRQYS